MCASDTRAGSFHDEAKAPYSWEVLQPPSESYLRSCNRKRTICECCAHIAVTTVHVNPQIAALQNPVQLAHETPPSPPICSLSSTDGRACPIRSRPESCRLCGLPGDRHHHRDDRSCGLVP